MKTTAPKIDLINLKFLFFLIACLINIQLLFSQVLGDFRSKQSGNWEDPNSWQYFNGSTWVDASTISKYPGQSGVITNNVTIQRSPTHIITITTNLSTTQMGNVIVNGTLNINTLTPNVVNLKTPLLSIDKGTLYFIGSKLSLYLPEGSTLGISNGGNIDGSSCSNNIEIFIGSIKFAVCNGGGNTIPDFKDVIANGGSFTAEITAPINEPTIICNGQTIPIRGKYTGTNPNNINYQLEITGPNNFSFTSGVINTLNPETPISNSFTPTLAGNYILTFTISTTINQITITNVKTRTITVNGILGTTSASRCGIGPVTLGATASSGTINWYSSPIGGTSLGTGTSFTTPSISSSTTYYVDVTGCTSTRTAVTATVNTTPTITGTSPNSICGTGTVTLGATASSGTLNWYSAPTGGISLGTGTTFVTPSISASTTYYVDVTNNGCTSTRTPVTATVNTIPTITGTSPNSRCGTGTVTLSATVSSGTLNWYSAPTGGISLGTGTTFVTPSISASTTYYVDATNNGCTSARTPVTATVNSINTWLGIDTNWTNPVNWTCGIPTNGSDILIPSGLSIYPTLATDISLNNIEIQSGATLNVLNNGLTITGLLTLNGKLDLQNESQLIQSSGSTLVSTGVNGIIEIDQQGSSDSYSYNYWSSPVNSILGVSKYTISGVLRDGTNPNSIKIINFGSSHTYADGANTDPIKLSTYWMYKYINKLSGSYNEWTHVGNNGVLNAGEGFTMKGSNADSEFQNYTFIGKPNNGDILLSINSGNQYLVGNPYPSAIDARAFIKDNISVANGGNNSADIIDGNLYFWDHYGYSTHLLNSYQGGYAIYNLSGGVEFTRSSVGGITPPPGIKKMPEQYVPVAQGFFVTSVTTGNIQFKNSQRVFKKEGPNQSQFIRISGKSYTKNSITPDEDPFQRIYLRYTSPVGYQRQLLVAFVKNTTEGVDIGYDAVNKERLNDDMSWSTPSEKMIIQAVPELKSRTLPLEIKASSNGLAKINIDLLENIPTDFDIFILDNLTGLLHNVKSAPFEINLTTGTYTNRFELVLRQQSTLAIEENVLTENLLTLYLDNVSSNLYISNNQVIDISEVIIYNMVGQQLQTVKNGIDVQLIEIPMNVQSGVYLVKVKTNKGTISKKIFKL